MPQNLTTTNSGIRESVKQLLAYIKAQAPSFQFTLDHFPAPDEKLTFPAVTVAAKNPKFNPVMPYVIEKGEPYDISDDQDGTDMVCDVTKVIGSWDFSYQMDVWTAYKPQRDSMVEEIVRVFNLGKDVHGINIELANYFNEFCHYSIDDIQYVDDEASSQRGEWRAMFIILAGVRCVVQSVEHLMQTIENNLETPQEIEAPPPSDDDGDPII